MLKDKISTLKPQTKNYSTLFSTVSKTWPSGPECWPRKYGWFSSGRTKQISNPETDHLFTPELNHHSIHGRRSRALAQALPTLNGRWNSSSQKPAFTIIEVVLVLAIAGLIFLMVFIALPALQRNQRDQQRKQDLNRALSALESYRGNNRGDRPVGNWDQLLMNSYLQKDGAVFQDPDGSAYTFVGRPQAVVGVLPDKAKYDDIRTSIYVYTAARCDGGRTVARSGDNNVALSIVLEGGGVYCVSN